ncbi:MAG: hypothetical protein HY961_14705 [Ignavibacteriae bacterium]|nr:hypothetical protein [Ignavibacteriota bacterium]
MQIRTIASYNRVLAFLLLFLSGGMSNAQNGKSIVVGWMEFMDESGQLIIGRNAFVDFRDDLVRHLEASNTLDLVAVEASESFLHALPRTRELAQKKLFALGTSLAGLPDTNHFYLIVTLTNLDRIVIANAVLYARIATLQKNSKGRRDTVMLDQRIHVEATYDAAAAMERRLADYLAADIVSQIEAKYDSSLRVLIAPFLSYGDDPAFEKLGGMIASMLRNRLSVSPRIRVIMSDSAYVSAAGRGAANRFRGWTLPELGLREGAKYVIGGSYFAQKGTMSIEASHVDVESGHSILSKSLFVDSLGGRRLYDALIALGDDMRNAIELNDAVKKKVPPTRISVAALPPFPPTAENKSLSLEIVTVTTRRLKDILAHHPRMNIAVSTNARLVEEYVEHETEPVVMARGLNTQFLWMIKLERPQRLFQMSVHVVDAETGSLQQVFADSFRQDFVGMNMLVDRLIDCIEEDSSKLGAGATFPSDSSSRRIRIPDRPATVAVIAAPPFPRSQENTNVSLGLARSLAKRLSLNKKLLVIPLEDRLDYYATCERCCSSDSLQRDLDVQFAWVLWLDDFGSTRRLHSALYHLSNPFDSTIADEADITHIDNLNDTFRSLTSRMLRQWSSGVAASDSLQEQQAQVIEFQPYNHAVRVRASAMGFTFGSGKLYLGNDHQVGVEASMIFLDSPRQYEISALYNFGKRDTAGGVTYDVIGRYFTALVRWNFPIHFGLKDWTYYVGAGIAALNVEARWTSVKGSLVLGAHIAAGIEIPFTYSLFLDFGGLFMYPVTQVSGIDGNYRTSFERPKYWSISGGVGYRF